MSNVHLTKSGSPAVWHMSLNGHASQGPKHYPPIDVKSHQTDTIVFKIDNPGITFAQSNAFCAQAGTSKPTTCGGPFTVSGAGTNQLTVIDLNTDPHATTYTYVLNFSDNSQLDPIINNGGNGLWGGVRTSTLLAEAALVSLVVALVVSLIVAYFTASRIARRATAGRPEQRDGM